MSLVLSLFPGIGLLDMAFEEEGFVVVRGPDLLWGGDIRRFHPPAGKFDGVIGGPPCQPFSPLVHLIRANGREPKHPNLIPEFERCVAEAEPEWFLMEEVPPAPEPIVHDYAVHSFILNNAALSDGTGIGFPQIRKRRFSFGRRGWGEPIDLRHWIQYAALELPDPGATVTVDYNSGWNYGHRPTTKQPAVVSGDRGLVAEPGRHDLFSSKTFAVTGDRRPVPVSLNGGGKVKARAVVAREMSGGISQEKLAWQRQNRKSGLAPGNYRKRSWEECCALQGLSPDFLAEAPFTKSGKFMVLGNGVPLPMGQAVVQAVKRALGENGQ